MGCGKSKAVRVAEQPELQAGGQSGQGCGSSAQHHLPCQTLPKNPATGVSGPSGSTSTTFIDPRAQLQAYIDSHPVVIFSKSTCKYCTEAKFTISTFLNKDTLETGTSAIQIQIFNVVLWNNANV
ncbi:thioredoxin reductase 1, cytoplasmic-like [Pteropus alecto]|uniref:thioredoxin reductase 1, cytoplasmic-like n=1 Tax=Pteropus alecto TaxID=9402 RepID=UPI000D536D06|nr:thioredoxin reductase 1, cytoplasmic-like [Pteropus alecto]